MIRTLVILCSLFFGLAACATTDSPTPTMRSVNKTEGPDLGSIRQFGIPSGRCGMILYTSRGSRAEPIFRSLDDGSGLMEVDGELRALTLIGRGGDTRQNVPSAQYFDGEATSSGLALRVVVQTSWGRSFPSGSYVQDGTLSVTDANGWSRVIPVAGIAGCKA